MPDRTRMARSGSGVRRARLEGGKRSGDGRTPRLKAGQAESPMARGDADMRTERSHASGAALFTAWETCAPLLSPDTAQRNAGSTADEKCDGAS